MVLISNRCLDECHFTNHYQKVKTFLLICVICYITHPVSINNILLLSKLNDEEYGECSVMNKQYFRSVYENKETCVANGVLLNELCLLRDGILSTDLSRTDIGHLIDCICIGWFYAFFVSFCRYCSYSYHKLLCCLSCIKHKQIYVSFLVLLSPFIVSFVVKFYFLLTMYIYVHVCVCPHICLYIG